MQSKRKTMIKEINKYDENELANRLIQGDEHAFCVLYALYKNRIIAFIYGFIKSKEVAKDLFQDTFVSLWQNRTFIESGTSFSSYLFSITRNRVYNYMRDEAFHQRILETVHAESSELTNETSQTIIVNDLNQHIQKAMNALSPKQREIFLMSRQQNLSHKEIAKKLNISVNTVQQHIYLSLKIVKKYVSDDNLIYEANLLLFLICIVK